MPAGGDRWSDLVSEMYCVVHEQAHLFEVTSQVVDVSSDGDRVTHGPWEAVECQSVLLPWHRAGWLDLLADVDPASRRLRGGVARAGSEGRRVPRACGVRRAPLLEDPSRWRLGTADGHVMLCLSDEGSRHAYDEWVERCRG